MVRPLFVFVGVFATLTLASSQKPLGFPGEGPRQNPKFDSQWMEYIKAYNKTYEGSELSYRRFIWEDNLATIFRHNEEMALGRHTYTMGVNAFTDWTFQEFSSRYLSAPRKIMTTQQNDTYLGLDVMTEYDTVDWREKGAVTRVKDQGHCGSCWAFSATGSIEGQNAIRNKKLIPLSEQMLIDCCQRFGEDGCNGGQMDAALACVKSMGGIESEKSYPYEAKDGTCRSRPSGFVAKVTGHYSWRGQARLHDMVQRIGPASVAMYATRNLQHYRSGVFSDTTCNTGKVNHGVLAVGYGDGYWLVKNSWGTRWGMEGYFKLVRGTSGMGMCMIAADINVPTM